MNAIDLSKTVPHFCLALTLTFLISGCSMEPEAGEVRVEIQEKISDLEKESLQDKLSDLRGSNGMTKTQDMNGSVVFVFGEVNDVEAYAAKIKAAGIAKIVETHVEKRTIVLSVK